MALEYDFVIRQGDTKPALNAVLLDQNNDVINLTGATVTFTMRSLTANTPFISAAAVTIVSASQGEVSYTFTAAQTAAAGQYVASFQIAYGDATTQTVPADGFYEISVEPNLTTAGGAQIVSLAELKDHLNIPATDRTVDAKLYRLIAQITPVIELFTGPVLLREVEEWHQGGQTFVELMQPPVAIINGVDIYVGPIQFTMTIIEDPMHGSSYSVMLEPNSAKITRRTTGGAVTPFPDGPETVHVWYQAGRVVIPQNIQLGVLELLRLNFNATQRGGAKFQGGSFERQDDSSPGAEIMGFFVPDRVREMLEPSRRSHGIW